MRRVPLLFIILLLSAVAAGQDIFTVIPEDSAVVAVAGDYRASLEAAKTFLEAGLARNTSLPTETQAAGVPFLAGALGARDSVAALLESCDGPGLDAGGPVAVAVILRPQAPLAVVAIRQADEAAWREANESRIREAPASPREILTSAHPVSFIFAGEYLVVASDAASLDAYEDVVAKCISAERAALLRTAMAEHNLVVNLSGPTVVRLFTGVEMALRARMEEFADAYSRCFFMDKSMAPRPGAVVSKVLVDAMNCSEEIFLGVNADGVSLEIAGTIPLKPGSMYSSILSQCKNSALDAGRLIPKRPAFSVGFGVGGDVFWAYSKGLMPPFTSSLADGRSHGVGALQLFTGIVDLLGESVGLERSAFLVCSGKDWTCPSPVFVGMVKDGSDAVTSITSSIVKVYSNELFVGHCKRNGFLLAKPKVTELMLSNLRTGVVEIPFFMSASDPLRATRIREVMGSSIDWRVTSLKVADGEVVVAGMFKSNQALQNFIAALDVGSALAGGGDTEETVLSFALDMPEFTADRLKVYLRSQGGTPGGVNIPATQKVCSLVFASEGNDINMSLSIPADQIRESFTALRNVKSSARSAPEPKPKPVPKQKTKDGNGEESGSTDSPGRLRSPWSSNRDD